MDSQEASSYGMGGWVDETFPADVVRVALESVAGRVDLPTFNAFFGRRLGRFRSVSESQQEKPSVADESSLVDEAMEYIQQLRLRLANLPPDTSAHIRDVCWSRRQESFRDFRSRLDADLLETWALLLLTERKLEPFKDKAGRKSAFQRDWFLHDVAHHLERQGIGKVAAAGVAAGVLRAIGVDAPDDPAEARKLVRGVENTMG